MIVLVLIITDIVIVVVLIIADIVIVLVLIITDYSGYCDRSGTDYN